MTRTTAPSMQSQARWLVRSTTAPCAVVGQVAGSGGARVARGAGSLMPPPVARRGRLRPVPLSPPTPGLADQPDRASGRRRWPRQPAALRRPIFHTTQLAWRAAARGASRRASWSGVGQGVINATGTPRPSVGRTVAIFRPGCTAGVTAPRPSGPMCSAAASRSSTLMTRPQNQAGPSGTPRAPRPPDQAAAAEAVEPLSDLTGLADAAQRRPVADSTAGMSARGRRWRRRRGRGRSRRWGARRARCRGPDGRGPQTAHVETMSSSGGVEARQRPPLDARLGVGIEPDPGAEQRDHAVDDGQPEPLPRLGRAADDDPFGAGAHVGGPARAARRGT